MYRPRRILAPFRSPYGYDVLVEIGKLRYLKHYQRSEIQKHLQERGVCIPLRTISDKSVDFLVRLTAVHIESLENIGALLRQRGGYVLHIDATGTKGTPMVLLMKDGWSGIRLLSASISTEGAEYIQPHLQTLSRYLGNPLVAVRDMGPGMEAALRDAFPGLYIVTCHYHFLKAVGQILFDPVYPRFRNSVDRRGVKKKLRALQKLLHHRAVSSDDERRTAAELIDYVLQFPKDGNGLGYPFSLPAVDFYQRCDETRGRVRTTILDRAQGNRCSPLLVRLEEILNLLNPPPVVLGRIRVQFLSLNERWRWFERIRRALRYRNGPIPLSTDTKLSEKELEKGRQKLDQVREHIRQFVDSGAVDKQSCELRKALRKVAKRIDERRDELFAPNISVKTGDRLVTRRVPRTNTPIEKDFRYLRRHGRRIQGNSDVEQMVQREGVGMLIAMNLENRAYVRAVYGTLDHMPERFAQVSEEVIVTAKLLMGISVR